jgi:DNA-binding NarL/FixJ family response regulator
LSERETLTMLARGHSYASVPGALELKVGTIQTHLENIYRKLEVCSKAEAASVAIRKGLIGI